MLCNALFQATRRAMCAAGVSGEGQYAQSIKDKVEEQIRKEEEVLSRVACYPHRILTRPVLPVTSGQVHTPLFSAQLTELNKVAMDLRCLSFSAPKNQWDAAVVLVKNNPDETEFEVWVNPQVPTYDDRNSVAAMFGMWENCISCGACNAWVVRPQRITCTGWDAFGNEKVEVLDGMRARCLMHELDHLKGRTIIQQALGAEFVVSSVAMGQRDLWPVNFPSAEAYVTAPNQFFDYVTNTTIIPPGLEWWYAQNSGQQFADERIQS